MTTQKHKLEALGLYDGTEVSCYIGDDFVKNALFRYSEDNDTCYIEQNITKGESLEKSGLSFLKYIYSWNCDFLGGNEFTDGVNLTPFFNRQEISTLLSSNIIPVSFQTIINDRLISTTIISIPNSEKAIYNISSLNLNDNQSQCIKKYYQYIKDQNEQKVS